MHNENTENVAKKSVPDDENLELTSENVSEKINIHISASDEGGKKKNAHSGRIAGAAGVGGYVLGLLTPIAFFPHDEKAIEVDENEQDPERNIEEPKGESAPELLHKMTPHEMEVATGVEDEMSFSKAFATARREVGPGGLFVWRGHTYGTYYANEWDAMGAEEREQYWNDVYYTTSNIEYHPDQNPAQIDLEVTDDDITLDIDDNDENDQNDSGDGVTLVLDENDVYAAVDFDEDGQVDGLVVDVDKDPYLDVVLDSTGDGNIDTLILNPGMDEEGHVIVDEDKVFDIDGVIIRPDEPANDENVTDNTENDDLLLVQNDSAIADEQLSADDLV